jgi:uncharacterized protein (TIGR02145 family)
MKTLVFSVLMIIAAYEIQAQNYLINFAGTGAATVVDSVKVENLSQCTSLSLAGTDTLLLQTEVGIEKISNRKDYSLSVSPNPSSSGFSVLIETLQSHSLPLEVCDISGKVLLIGEVSLESGRNLFTLTGIPCGLYILKAGSGKSFQTVKLISTAAGAGTPHLERVGSVPVTTGDGPGADNPLENAYRGVQSVIAMPFNPGDTLKLTGKSGIYRTICMLFPSSNQTVVFSFAGCMDIESNHYAVVQIGSQLWMQENLKTTKYRDGSDIPNVTDSATWANLTTGAYCNFHNLPEEGEKYGRLYNFYAIADSRQICPVGWHVPSNSEWNILDKFLDSTVDTTALAGTGLVIGRVLKEGCDTRWQYWDTTYGFNSAGFTALCANFRTAIGSWSLAPDNNHDTSFWTSTAYDTGSAWFRSLRWCYGDIYQLFAMKKGGDSVRCVRDN